MNIAVMCDALEELSELSVSLQAESVSIQKAHRLIARELEVFTARKSDGGDKYEIASTAVEDGNFRGVPIVASNSKTDRLINKSQFCFKFREPPHVAGQYNHCAKLEDYPHFAGLTNDRRPLCSRLL